MGNVEAVGVDLLAVEGQDIDVHRAVVEDATAFRIVFGLMPGAAELLFDGLAEIEQRFR